MLSSLIKQKRLKATTLARRLGVSDAFISQVRKGLRVPDVDNIPQWCSALELTRAEAEEFTDAVHLAASKPRMQARVKRLEREVARLRKGRK